MADWIGSPNYDSNRKPIKQIVIHWFGSEGSTLASTDSFFQKPSGTSAHYAVEDTTVHQYVKEEHVAYAVGNYTRNQETISIELSANVKRNASEATYKTSAKLLREIADRYGIPLDRKHIIKHSEIVPTQCCGTVDVDRLINLAKETPMTDKRIQFFEVLRGGIWGNIAWETLTDEQVAKVAREYKSQYLRSGLWDKICRLAGFSGDTNIITVQTLYEKLVGKYTALKEGIMAALAKT